MKKERGFPAFTVSEKCENSIRAGHPWVYEDEIMEAPASPENGTIADVFSKKGRYLGSGFISLHSKIRIRILSRNANETFGEAFFRRRIRYAIDYRKTVLGTGVFGRAAVSGVPDTACRLIHGEADGMPGLTADLYGDVLVLQVLSFGMDRIRETLCRIFTEELAAEGIVLRGIMERNDVAIRELEGLPQGKGWVRADFLPEPPASPETEITENGIRYLVDVENGQKTGFFLDQKLNRLAVSKIAAGKRVLDCFTHTGSFALNAAAGGAAHVTAVDVSAFAVETARRNAERNGFIAAGSGPASGMPEQSGLSAGKDAAPSGAGRPGIGPGMEFVCADVFDLLPRLAAERADYDLVILDPPAFTKSRKTVGGAQRGYKEINYRAMKLLPRGGYLATCSCSHFMSHELFLEMLQSAAADAGVRLKLIESRGPSPDHPVLLGVPETDYLKFYLLQIV